MKRILAALLVALMAFAAFGCDKGDTDLPVDVTDPQGTPSLTEQPEGLGLAREPFAANGMVAAGAFHSLGLRTDGSVLSAGHDTAGQRQVSAWSDVVYIAAGKTVSLGVKKDGSLLVAGTLTDGAAADTAKAWKDVYMADAGDDFIVALHNDGTVTAAGDNSAGQCDVSGWSDMIWIAAGNAFTLGLKADGTVVGTSGAPDVASWAKIVKLAAGGQAGAAGVTSEGKVVATVDVSALAAYADVVSVAVDDCGVACVRADGTVVTALAAGVTADAVYTDGEADPTTVAGAVAVAAGAKHIVMLRQDGTALGFGSNDDLQCDVGSFNLRPYVEQLDGASFVRGLPLGATVAQAKPMVALFTGATEVKFAKADGTDAADTDVIATGMVVTKDGQELGAVVIMGDVNGDGAIDATDKDKTDKLRTFAETAEGAFYRAAKLSLSFQGVPSCDENSVNAIAAHIDGSAPIAQFDHKNRGDYDEKFAAAYSANTDTVGYIIIPGTNIDYPIMFDKSGKWYYNDHTPEKKSADSGSIYSYYHGLGQNVVVTGHNSRPSGSMFHQLHHIQEFNLGETNCAQKKYCGVELKNLPDLKVYSNRVWTLYLFGEESKWEMFSMYETEAGCSIKETLYDNVWWPYGDDNFNKTTTEAVQKWVDKQISLTSIPFDAKVSSEDRFLTVFTCGNEHDDASKGARLYFFFKKVD